MEALLLVLAVLLGSFCLGYGAWLLKMPAPAQVPAPVQVPMPDDLFMALQYEHKLDYLQALQKDRCTCNMFSCHYGAILGPDGFKHSMLLCQPLREALID